MGRTAGGLGCCGRTPRGGARRAQRASRNRRTSLLVSLASSAVPVPLTACEALKAKLWTLPHRKAAHAGAALFTAVDLLAGTPSMLLVACCVDDAAAEKHLPTTMLASCAGSHTQRALVDQDPKAETTASPLLLARMRKGCHPQAPRVRRRRDENASPLKDVRQGTRSFCDTRREGWRRKRKLARHDDMDNTASCSASGQCAKITLS